MAKKPRSPKQLANDKKLAEKAKARAEAKKANPVVPSLEQDLPEDPSIASVPAGVVVAPLQPIEPEAAKAYTPDYSDLESNPLYPTILKMQEQIEALTAANANVTPLQKVDQLASMQGATINGAGVAGQVFKYPVDAGYYPDPTEELYNDPTLRRFALKENFFIKWEVTGVNYEKNNVAYVEPRFEVAMYRYMYDEEGQPNGKMFLVGRHYLHEDELYSRMAAQQLGLQAGVDYQDIPELMNLMRMHRIQKWMRDSFKPISIKGYAKKSTTMVINGKQVEVFDTEDVVEKAKAEEQSAIIKAETAINRNF